MIRNLSRTRLLVALAIAAGANVGACAPLGGLGDVVGGTTLTGEVRSIDTRRNSISVRHDRGGDQRVRYDGRTRVYDGQRQYPVSVLNRGDRVHMQLSHDRNGTAWADRIEVRSSSRSRPTASNRVERLDGVVRSVDRRRGYFTIERNRTTTTILVPSRLNSSDMRRFDRLRRGDRVRVDVRRPGRGTRAELVRFR